MKNILFLFLIICLPISVFCQTDWNLAYNSDIERPQTIFENITIDKNACTITKNGKTFKLYGKVKIVNSFADIKVQIVSSFPDIKAKIVDHWADSCGKITLTDSFPDLKVQIVSSFADLKVEIVDHWPGF